MILLLGLVACAHKAPVRTAAGGGKAPAAKQEGTSASGAGTAQPVEPFYEASSEKDLSAEQASGEEKEPEEQVIGGEVEEEIAKSVQKEVPTFDIPIVINAEVEKWMEYFQGRGRKYYLLWLIRSERYIPMMQKILRENGLPEDLVYLAMIESGFKPYAYSRARASGPWQFIKGTGRLYGLRTNFWLDERRDPEKSTIAAAQHLKDLYDQFNSWYLAASAYNAGAGKISKAIRKYSTEDFWEMSRSKNRYLRSETKNYVPKLIAAALMAKSPERYGFTNIQFENPLEYDKVQVPEPTEIARVAEALKMDPRILFDLNPELLRGITPPGMPDYELKIPKGFREKFVAVYPGIRSASAVTVARHVAKRGESLASIARKYGVNAEAVATFNQLKGKKIKSGQQLAIPYYVKAPKERYASVEEAQIKGRKKASYKVRHGDTLWSISRRFDVSVSSIRNWNDLEGRNIYPGQKLKLYARADPAELVAADVPPPPAPATASAKAPPSKDAGGWITYQVADGDTLWNIAKKYNVTVSDLSAWNQVQDDDIRAGQTLKIRAQ
ncbi:MAG: LysM peptidoglycan-binding domain-containing protein [Pseudomonadota bacterium]